MSKQIKYSKDYKLAINGELDGNAEGKAHRFTFGEVNGPVSGAVYFQPDEIVPNMLIIILNPKGGDIEQVNTPELDEVEG